MIPQYGILTNCNRSPVIDVLRRLDGQRVYRLIHLNFLDIIFELKTIIK